MVALLRLLVNPMSMPAILLPVFGVVGLSYYVAFLHLFGEFRGSDLKLFKESVNPKKMAQYMKTELKSEGV